MDTTTLCTILRTFYGKYTIGNVDIEDINRRGTYSTKLIDRLDNQLSGNLTAVVNPFREKWPL